MENKSCDFCTYSAATNNSYLQYEKKQTNNYTQTKLYFHNSKSLAQTLLSQTKLASSNIATRWPTLRQPVVWMKHQERTSPQEAHESKTESEKKVIQEALSLEWNRKLIIKVFTNSATEQYYFLPQGGIMCASTLSFLWTRLIKPINI